MFTPAFILQAINSAARYVAREMRNRGKTTLIEDDYKVTIPAITAQDPTLQVFLTYTGITGNVPPANSPFLPPQLMEPLRISERPAGETCDFVPMHDASEDGGLPYVLQGARLKMWEWREDKICFLGATQDTDIIIRFSAVPNIFSLTDGEISGSLGDVDALDAVGYYAASQLLPKRGGVALAQTYRVECGLLIEQLATSTSRSEQFAPVRPKPYGRAGGRGGWPRGL